MKKAAHWTWIALAVLLAVGAWADPSGLFVPVGWTGHPIAAWWWWAPYVVYAPVALVLTHRGSRALLAGPRVGWVRRVLRLWAVVMLAMGAAQVVYGAVLLLPMIWQGRYVLPVASTAAFVLWSSGYAMLKMVLLGWLPAVVGASLGGSSAEVDAPRGVAASSLAGGTMFVLALLGPWLAAHWWQGSPMGYVYGQDGPLFAPSAASGPVRATLALALIGLVLWAMRVRGPASAAVASFVATLGLWLVQAVLCFMHAAPSGDSWVVPALIVRALEACSFALLCAAIAAGVAVIVARAGPSRRLGRPRFGLALAVFALLISGVQARQFSRIEAAPRAANPSATVQVLNTASGAMLADGQGARLILRGVNVNQLGEYAKQDPHLPDVLPLQEQDFADIAALGMNVVRLTLSWSELEPAPGQISQAYIARIAQALDWARAHDVHVVLDIHQDGWGAHVGAPPGTACRPGASPMIGWDGAPLWATLTDGTDPCQVTGRDMAPNVSRAFQSFYMDRDGIQTHLVQAWGALAKAFGADPIVAGYDLLNEPNFAETPSIASTLLLANFHARAIAAIREAEAARAGGFAHPVIVEPSIFWSGFGIDNLPPRDFTPDRQVVFSPHLYNESITSDQDFGLTLVSIERGFALAEAAARQLDMPLWIGEWGFFKAPGSKIPGLQRQTDAEDAGHIGSAFWVWKQACSDPHVFPNPIAGNVRLWHCPDVQEIGSEKTFIDALSRPYLQHSPDVAAVLHRDRDGLELSGFWDLHADRQAAACNVALWVPGDAAPRWGASDGIRLTGITRVAPGQASLGNSGGWIVRACLLGGRYRVRLSSSR